MSTALVGSSGFVGGNLALQYPFDEKYHSVNIAEGFGRPHSLVVYAGVPAEKYTANQNPAADAAVIEAAKENLRRLAPEEVVLISSADVYRDPAGADERSPMPTEGLQPYGADRLALERWVAETYPKSLVVRLPALFGHGLKKNFLFDILRIIPAALRPDKFRALAAKSELVEQSYHETKDGFYRLNGLGPEEGLRLRSFFATNDFNALSFTDSRAEYQFYSLNHLWDDIEKARAAGLRLLNVTSEPVSAAEIYRAVRGSEFVNELSAPPVRYDLRTCHNDVMGGKDGYIYSKQQVISELLAFVEGLE